MISYYRIDDRRSKIYSAELRGVVEVQLSNNTLMSLRQERDITYPAALAAMATVKAVRSDACDPVVGYDHNRGAVSIYWTWSFTADKPSKILDHAECLRRVSLLAEGAQEALCEKLRAEVVERIERGLSIRNAKYQAEAIARSLAAHAFEEAQKALKAEYAALAAQRQALDEKRHALALQCIAAASELTPERLTQLAEKNVAAETFKVAAKHAPSLLRVSPDMFGDAVKPVSIADVELEQAKYPTPQQSAA